MTNRADEKREMEVESMVKLAAGGNVSEVESQWLARLEGEGGSPDTVVQMVPVVAKMAERGHLEAARALAWTSLEMLGERFSPREVLRAAGPLLLKLKKSDELRQQVTELYRQAYSDREELEALISEAGMAVGRPVRRALRTMEVCLGVEPGSFVAARHDERTGQVSEIGASDWSVTVRDVSGKEETFGPVEFADTYEPVDADDFRVLGDFDPDRLRQRLNKDPAGVVISILQASGNKTDSDKLKAMLCPKLIEDKAWSRWWTKARTALKRCPHVEIEGRSPYWLEYTQTARTLEDETREQFVPLHEAGAELSVLEAYVKECATRKQELDTEFLQGLRSHVDGRAARQRKSGSKLLLGTMLVQRRIDEMLGREDVDTAAIELLHKAEDPLAYVTGLESASTSLWEAGCACLAEAEPGRAAERLNDLLLVAPMRVCDSIACRLVELGYSTEPFDRLIQQILAQPLRHHQAIMWLWDGPTAAEVGPVKPVMVLTRLLRMLADLRRSETFSRDEKRDIATTARSVLSARKYERFRACLEQVEAGMASALLTQIKRLDNLGRAVHEDLQKLIRERFPELTVQTRVEPWNDESVLYVTAHGLTAKMAERDELVNVKMKENAKRIGEAASHGDLSENSEYKFALEERDLLRSRLALMQGQINQAKVLVADEVDPGRVNIGTRVQLRHVESGQTVEVALLGPWEADIERYVFNYKAPGAAKILGLKVGATVALTVVEPEGEYEVVGIASALA
ncbi:MAG: GreA/GreB family elongation factor [Phycisphaerae bacterium]